MGLEGVTLRFDWGPLKGLLGDRNELKMPGKTGSLFGAPGRQPNDQTTHLRVTHVIESFKSQKFCEAQHILRF